MGGVCNTPLHGYMQKLSGFTFPYPDTPKTRSVLYPNPWRGTFRGVCNRPLHGYMKNLAGFIFPHPDTPKTHPVSYFPIGIRPKPRPVLYPNRRRGVFGGVCFCALHGYVQNPPDFRPKPSARIVSGRMQYAPIRIRAKFGGF